MDGGQFKNVCLSSVVCPLVVPNYFLTVGLIGIKKFSTKTREKKYVKILILELRGHSPSKAPRVDSGTKSLLAHNFCPIFTKSVFLQR
jgi:hypothetical protein